MSNNFTGLVRIGNDPEVKHTASGKSFLTFNAASSTGYGDNKKTLWLRVSYWNNAEKIHEYLKKGIQLVIGGELSQNEYVGKDEVLKQSLELNANFIDFVSVQDDKKNIVNKYTTEESKLHNVPNNNFDDDIPF